MPDIDGFKFLQLVRYVDTDLPVICKLPASMLSCNSLACFFTYTWILILIYISIKYVIEDNNEIDRMADMYMCVCVNNN